MKLVLFALAVLFPLSAISAQGVGDFGAWQPANPSVPNPTPPLGPPPISRPSAAPLTSSPKHAPSAFDIPRAEIYGGYSYLNADANGVSSRQSASGWQAATDVNLSALFAAEFGLDAHYKSYGPVSVSDYAFLAGPRVSFRPVFAHALVGWDELSAGYSGLAGSQSGFAAAIGGGVQFPLSRSIAIRGSGDYFVTRHGIPGSLLTQNNFRAGVGLVFRLGSIFSPRSR